jgi:hypothetical protein
MCMYISYIYIDMSTQGKRERGFELVTSVFIRRGLQPIELLLGDYIFLNRTIRPIVIFLQTVRTFPAYIPFT